MAQQYLYKIYKIFEKPDGVARTCSISSLKFLLKLASHYEKLQNMSQVFHPRWEITGFVHTRRQNHELVSIDKVLRLFIDKLQVWTRDKKFQITLDVFRNSLQTKTEICL